jgi:hypothetical protein
MKEDMLSQVLEKYIMSAFAKFHHAPVPLNWINLMKFVSIWFGFICSVLGLQEEDNLIQQVCLTKSEFNKTFRDAPLCVLNDVLLPEGAQDTNATSSHQRSLGMVYHAKGPSQNCSLFGTSML